MNNLSLDKLFKNESAPHSDVKSLTVDNRKPIFSKEVSVTDRKNSNQSIDHNQLLSSIKSDLRVKKSSSKDISGKTSREVLAKLVQGSFSVRKQQNKFMLTGSNAQSDRLQALSETPFDIAGKRQSLDKKSSLEQLRAKRSDEFGGTVRQHMKSQDHHLTKDRLSTEQRNEKKRFTLQQIYNQNPAFKTENRPGINDLIYKNSKADLGKKSENIKINQQDRSQQKKRIKSNLIMSRQINHDGKKQVS